MQTSTTYEVSEYHTAAAIRAAGVPMLSATPRNGRIVFTFDDKDGAATRIAERHLRGDLEINSRSFADSLQSIKTLMFEARRAGGLG